MKEVVIACLAFDLVNNNQLRAALYLILSAKERGYITEAQAKLITETAHDYHAKKGGRNGRKR